MRRVVVPIGIMAWKGVRLQSFTCEVLNIHSERFVMYFHLLLYPNVTGKQFFAFAVKYVSDSFMYSGLQFAERIFCFWHCSSEHYMHYIAEVGIPSAHSKNFHWETFPGRISPGSRFVQE